jgi:hypothetical protein
LAIVMYKFNSDKRIHDVLIDLTGCLLEEEEDKNDRLDSLVLRFSVVCFLDGSLRTAGQACFLRIFPTLFNRSSLS